MNPTAPSQKKPADFKPLERLTGVIERVTFHNPENGFCVLKVKMPRHADAVPVTGFCVLPKAGEYIESQGLWMSDPKFGRQFKAETLHIVPPSTAEGVEKYLSSGMVKGIGQHFAKQLVDTFKGDVFDVIENHPERLKELTGIGKKRQQQLIDAWDEQKSIRDIMVFLQSHGIGTARAVKIYKMYGDKSIDKVRENPYRLAYEIHGMGFKTVDELALNLGIPKEAMIRAQAAVRSVLTEATSKGDCARAKTDLVHDTACLVGIHTDIVEQALALEIEHKNIIEDTIGDRLCYYTAPLHQAELSVAKQIQRLNLGPCPWGKIDTQESIASIIEASRIELSTSQLSALSTMLTSKVSVMTGGPGVGKTTLINSFIKILRPHGIEMSLCAPTGRAAKRLAESTGLTAKTIHRLLEFDPVIEGRFKRHSHNPLPTELVIIDESSMVDIVLMGQLLRAIPDSAGLLIVGDVDQLPSVGPGAVLSDIIESEAVPVVKLTKIFRQAEGSRIITSAHQINQGQCPSVEASDTLSDFYLINASSPDHIQDLLFRVVTQRIPERFGFDPIDDVQVLTPMQKGALGARALNLNLQKALNGDTGPHLSRLGWTFAAGDKVIQMVNNYDKEIFNGDTGRIVSVDTNAKKLTIRFDGRLVPYTLQELDEISLAYATSIHKSQGSEYPAVVIPLSTQHYTLLERHLLYTGVTRGKKLVVIIAEPRALSIAVRTARANLRLTKLASRLRSL